MQQFISKKWAIAGVLASLLLASACSSSNNGSSGGEKASSPAPAASSASASASAAESAPSAPSNVEQLTIGVPADSGPLNIYTTSNDYMTELVFDKLFGPSPYVDDPIPLLAESAEQIDDLTWRLKVKSGISWHDGVPFTADDVKFTYEYYRDGPQNRYTHHVNEVPSIKEINKLGDNELEFKCEYACPSLQTVTFADLPILAKHIWENVENPRQFTDLAIGTGPYKLAEYVPEQYYKLEANEQYYLGAPTVKTLYMPIIADQTAMFNSLRAGEIDAAAKSVPAELLSSFDGAGDFKVQRTAELTIIQLVQNYKKEPFDNEDFRKAMSLAINRQDISDTVLLGRGRPGLQGYPHPDSPWTNPDNAQPYDPALANSLLDTLGFKDSDSDGVREYNDGSPMEMSLIVTSGEPSWIRAAELMIPDYAAIGVKLNVEVLDQSTVSARSSEKQYDFMISSIGAHGVADPDQFIMSNRSSYLWDKAIPYPELDALQQEWMAANTIEARKEVSFRMQAMYNDQPTAIALYYPEQNWAYNAKKFDGWVETLGFGIIHKYSFLGETGKKLAAGTPL